MTLQLSPVQETDKVQNLPADLTALYGLLKKLTAGNGLHGFIPVQSLAAYPAVELDDMRRLYEAGLVTAVVDLSDDDMNMTGFLVIAEQSELTPLPDDCALLNPDFSEYITF